MNQKPSQIRSVHQARRKASPGGRARIARSPVGLRSAGQELLRQAIEAEGFGLRQLEDITGISKTMMSCLLGGTKSPGNGSAELLSRMFGVPELSWEKSPGWRPSDWAPRGTDSSCILSAWAWTVGLLVPSKLSIARLERDREKHRSGGAPTIEGCTATVWTIVRPELDRLPQQIKIRLGLPVGGQAPADMLRTLIVGLIGVACSREFDRTYDALVQADAIEQLRFLNDLANEVSDAPEAA